MTSTTCGSRPGPQPLWSGIPAVVIARIPRRPAGAQSRLRPLTNGALRDFTFGEQPGNQRWGAVPVHVSPQRQRAADSSRSTLCSSRGAIEIPPPPRPFEYMLHAIVQQRGGVTITSNVIHPENGQTAYVHYTVSAPGPVTITVFDLSGSIVNVLQRGSQSSGEYTTVLGRQEPRRARRGSRDLLHQGGGSGIRRNPQGARREIAAARALNSLRIRVTLRSGGIAAAAHHRAFQHGPRLSWLRGAGAAAVSRLTRGPKPTDPSRCAQPLQSLRRAVRPHVDRRDR